MSFFLQIHFNVSLRELGTLSVTRSTIMPSASLMEAIAAHASMKSALRVMANGVIAMKQASAFAGPKVLLIKMKCTT